MGVFFDFANTIGILSFALTGAQVARNRKANAFLAVFCGVLTAFGGGIFFRDLAILRIAPAIFSDLIMISPAFLIVGAFLLYEKKIQPMMEHNTGKVIFRIFDSIGLGAFICLGIDKALSFQIPVIAAFFAGVLTALGGGILALVIHEKKPKAVLFADTSYRLIAVICGMLYLVLLNLNFSPNNAKIIVLVAAILLPLFETISIATITAITSIEAKEFGTALRAKAVKLTLGLFSLALLFSPTPAKVNAKGETTQSEETSQRESSSNQESSNIIAKETVVRGKTTLVKSANMPINAKVYKEGFYSYPLTKEIKERITGKSYKKNKTISYDDLRYVRVKHYDFNGKVQSGELIVNKKIATDITKIFYELYKKKYPIEKMVLIDNYGADDDRSMGANNTSSFNYRTVAGKKTLSKHATGMAIDINPKINPWVVGNKVLPVNGKVYAQRNVSRCSGIYKNYMIQKNDTIVKIFKKYGFSWGGNWKNSKDYQHFEK